MEIKFFMIQRMLDIGNKSYALKATLKHYMKNMVDQNNDGGNEE